MHQFLSTSRESETIDITKFPRKFSGRNPQTLAYIPRDWNVRQETGNFLTFFRETEGYSQYFHTAYSYSIKLYQPNIWIALQETCN